MYTIIARIKGAYRWLVFQVLTAEFSPYSDACRETSGYEGSYSIGDRCVAFRRDDGTIQYVW